MPPTSNKPSKHYKAIKHLKHLNVVYNEKREEIVGTDDATNNNGGGNKNKDAAVVQDDNDNVDTVTTTVTTFHLHKVDVMALHEDQNPNKRGIPNDVYTEEMMEFQFEKAFDQPKIESGFYADGDDAEEPYPYRYINNWYIYNKNSRNKREKLPLKRCHFPKTHILAGWVEPSPKQPLNKKPVVKGPVFLKLELANTQLLFDRTDEYRGLWIQTKRALYWLQQPCNFIPPVPNNNNNALSQEDQFWEAREFLTAVSFLLKRVFTSESTTTTSCSGKTVKEVLEERPFVKTKKFKKEDLALFESYLLAKHKNAIQQHLKGYVDEHCTFMKTLMDLKPRNNQLTAENLRRWSRAAEIQLGHHCWGGMLGSESVVYGEDFVALADEEFELESKQKRDLVAAESKPVKEVVGGDRTVPDVPESDARIIEKDEPVKRDRLVAENLQTAARDDMCPRRQSGTSSTITKRKGIETTESPRVNKKRKKTQSIKSSELAEATPTVSSDGDIYSETYMQQSLTLWTDYLVKEPSRSDSVTKLSRGDLVGDWSHVCDSSKFYLDVKDEGKMDEFYTKLVKSDLKKERLENLLLPIEALCNSFEKHGRKKCPGALKNFFRKVYSDEKQRCAYVVFEKFRDHAVGVLQARATRKRDCRSTSATWLLAGIARLIVECKLLQKPGVLEKLEERDIHLEKGLESMSQCCRLTVHGDDWVANVINPNLQLARKTIKNITNKSAARTGSESQGPGSEATQREGQSTSESQRPDSEDKHRNGQIECDESLRPDLDNKQGPEMAQKADPIRAKESSAGRGPSVRAYMPRPQPRPQSRPQPQAQSQHASSPSKSENKPPSPWDKPIFVTAWGNGREVAINVGEIQKEFLGGGEPIVVPKPSASPRNPTADVRRKVNKLLSSETEDVQRHSEKAAEKRSANKAELHDGSRKRQRDVGPTERIDRHDAGRSARPREFGGGRNESRPHEKLRRDSVRLPEGRNGWHVRAAKDYGDRHDSCVSYQRELQGQQQRSPVDGPGFPQRLPESAVARGRGLVLTRPAWQTRSEREGSGGTFSRRSAEEHSNGDPRAYEQGNSEIFLSRQTTSSRRDGYTVPSRGDSRDFKASRQSDRDRYRSRSPDERRGHHRNDQDSVDWHRSWSSDERRGHHRNDQDSVDWSRGWSTDERPDHYRNDQDGGGWSRSRSPDERRDHHRSDRDRGQARGYRSRQRW